MREVAFGRLATKHIALPYSNLLVLSGPSESALRKTSVPHVEEGRDDRGAISLAKRLASRAAGKGCVAVATHALRAYLWQVVDQEDRKESRTVLEIPLTLPRLGKMSKMEINFNGFEIVLR